MNAEDVEAALRGRVRRLRQEVARLSPREDLGYVFIVAYGRSGSTLMQGVLNSIPGYLIRGENHQLLRHFYEGQMPLARLRRNSRLADTADQPFYGMSDFPLGRYRKEVRRLAQQTLLRPEDDTRVTGYKEIRWEYDDLANFVTWMRNVFPGARFLVNTRNLDDVATSKWWAERPDARDHLAAVEARILAVAGDLGDDAYRVHYDDYAKDIGTLRGMFDWLGEEYDEPRLRAVMEKPHSY